MKNAPDWKSRETAQQQRWIYALKNYIVDAILLIALGLVMLIWPQWSLQIIFKWVGIGLIVTGLIKGVIYFTKKEKKERSLSDLLVGIAQLAAGIFVVVKAEFLSSHFPTVAAILLAYGAIMMIVRAVRMKDGDQNKFRLSLILGIVTLVLAVVVFVHPAVLANLMMQATGIAMIVEGISLLIVMAQKEKGE